MLENMVNAVKNEIERDVEAVKECFGVVPNQPGDGNRRPNPLQDMGHRKVAELSQEFHDCLPIFERAGFVLLNFEVEVGLSPKFIPHFHITKIISQDERRAILEEVRNQYVIKLILESLFKASTLSQHIRIGNLVFRGLEVHVSAIPTVRMLFGRQRKPSITGKGPQKTPPPLPERSSQRPRLRA